MKILRILKQTFSYNIRSPISLDLVKTQQGRQQIKVRLQKRYKSPDILNSAVSRYEIFRKDLYQYELASQECNAVKKQLKDCFQNKEDEERIKILKDKLGRVKEQLELCQKNMKQSKILYEEIVQKIGNEVHQQTPVSDDEGNNSILKYFHPEKSVSDIASIKDHNQFIKDTFQSNASKGRNYQLLTQKFGIADLPRGQKVSGHRGYFLCNNGVKLALALAQYGLDFMQKRGYTLYQTPALILESVLRDSCQLQSIQSDMYRFKQDNLCLIATSEQSLAGFYKSQTLQPKQLPKKMAGYSSCFRREAGAHGKDIHGLFRLHQFQKVQQFVVCNPSQSQAMMKQMVQNSELFFQSLNIPYRLVDIVSGQLNDAAIRKIDLEGWYPSQQKFRELVSIANCTDYQSRMLQTKYRDGKNIRYPHMLNGTLVAIQRTITCLLQHFYSEQQNVLKIPLALQPYIRTQILKPL